MYAYIHGSFCVENSDSLGKRKTVKLATLAKVQNHKAKAGALEEIQLIRPVH